MTGHGSKFRRKMEQAVIAVFSTRNLDEAAKSVGVSAKTLQRWQKQPEFEKALRTVQMATFRQSLGRLHQASGPAVTTLLKTMVDPASPPAVKARCAYYILDQLRKGVETENIEVRLSAIEAANNQKPG